MQKATGEEKNTHTSRYVCMCMSHDAITAIKIMYSATREKNDRHYTDIFLRREMTRARTVSFLSFQSPWFDFVSTSMNTTQRAHPYAWPYALRGSVTLIIENTTVENFEKTLYRPLQQSIARIVRKFCSIYEESCSSADINAIRLGEEQPVRSSFSIQLHVH